MKLNKHICQGKLLHRVINSAGLLESEITVSENNHFRWMAFDDVVQSVMNKRKPWLLTLPHQNVMLFPLLFFKPNNIVELGLGGGNIRRFIEHLSSNIQIDSVEHSAEVIDCFNQYFSPDSTTHSKQPANLINANQAKRNTQLFYQDSNIWLFSKESKQYDWYICDIYQQNLASYDSTVKHLSSLMDHITGETCLTINVPDATDNEIALCLMLLKEQSVDHNVVYFNIPNYLNVVILLIPKHWQLHQRLRINSNSYLAKSLFSRWKKFWELGNIYSP
jgi:spermidine synthase